jgi:hypothetical protein
MIDMTSEDMEIRTGAATQLTVKVSQGQEIDGGRQTALSAPLDPGPLLVLLIPDRGADAA